MTSHWLEVFAYPLGVPCPEKLMLKVKVLVTQSSLTHCDPVDCSHSPQRSRLLCPWNSPGKNTGVGSHSIFQGIMETRDRTWSHALHADSLPSEPSGALPWKVTLTTLFLIASHPTTLSFPSLINLFLYSLILNNFCIL